MKRRVHFEDMVGIVLLSAYLEADDVGIILVDEIRESTGIFAQECSQAIHIPGQQFLCIGVCGRGAHGWCDIGGSVSKVGS